MQLHGELSTPLMLLYTTETSKILSLANRGKYMSVYNLDPNIYNTWFVSEVTPRLLPPASDTWHGLLSRPDRRH